MSHEKNEPSPHVYPYTLIARTSAPFPRKTRTSMFLNTRDVIETSIYDSNKWQIRCAKPEEWLWLWHDYFKPALAWRVHHGVGAPSIWLSAHYVTDSTAFVISHAQSCSQPRNVINGFFHVKTVLASGNMTVGLTVAIVFIANVGNVVGPDPMASEYGRLVFSTLVRTYYK